jgi:hypothetical protein
MVKKLYITILIAVILCVIASAAILLNQPFSNQPPATTVVAGVAVGGTFTYDIKGLARVIDSNATIPENFFQLNMTKWYRVTITHVTNAEVSFNTTWRFSNGTEIEKTGKVNIETGKDNSLDFWAIYASGLNAGEFARPFGTDRLAINATEERTYNDGERETNRVSLENQFYDADDPTLSRTYDDYLSIYFDKQTGMLVELVDVKLYSSPQIILTLQWKIIESNVWNIS